MNAYELADAMETRASIRRKAIDRKSVQENSNDRIADQLEQASTMLRQQANTIKAYEKVLVMIANDYPELSYDKAKLQNLDHIKWAKEILKGKHED